MRRTGEFVVQPSATSLSRLRQAVDALVHRQVPASVRQDLLLALDEAVCNALVHGAGGDVTVNVRLEDDNVSVTVCDTGDGFDIEGLVHAWPPPFCAESGRGIYLMTRLMDSVVVSAAGPTIIHMSRSLSGEQERSQPVCVWTSPSVARFAHN